MSTTPNPPAFPNRPCDQVGQPIIEASEGMSLRDYFAAKAMAAFIAKIPPVEIGGRDGCAPVTEETLKEMRKGMAHSAYSQADAMLLTRLHTQEGGKEEV